MGNSVGNVATIVQSMHKQEQSDIGASDMSEDKSATNQSISNINKMRMNFFDIRRCLKLMREAANNASWYTIRHAEVALFLFDMVPDFGLEQQLVHKAVGLNQSTTHRILNSFEKIGWIRIETDKNDERLRRIFITTNPIADGYLTGHQVSQMLLEAGTPRDTGALLQRNFEAQLMQTHNVVSLVPQNITMKAEVGAVRVVTGSANVNVTSSATASAQKITLWEAEEVWEKVEKGEVYKHMDRADGRWSIYPVGTDHANSEPIAVQKNWDKKLFNKTYNDLETVVITFIDDIEGKKLSEVLSEWAEKLNIEEYQVLRQKLMVSMSKQAEQQQKIAEAQNIAAAASKSAADTFLEQQRLTQFTHQENMFHALAHKHMQEWAQHQASADDALSLKDRYSELMAMMQRNINETEQWLKGFEVEEEQDDG